MDTIHVCKRRFTGMQLFLVLVPNVQYEPDTTEDGGNGKEDGSY
jgi:hypothetical protein